MKLLEAARSKHTEPDHMMPDLVQKDRQPQGAGGIRRLDGAILTPIAIDTQRCQAGERVAPTTHAQTMLGERVLDDGVVALLGTARMIDSARRPRFDAGRNGFHALGLGPLTLGLGPLTLGLGPLALGLGPLTLGLGPLALGARRPGANAARTRLLPHQRTYEVEEKLDESHRCDLSAIPPDQLDCFTRAPSIRRTQAPATGTIGEPTNCWRPRMNSSNAIRLPPSGCTSMISTTPAFARTSPS